MPPRDLERLARTRAYDGHNLVVVRPGIALVMYSRADLAPVMKATADALEAYLDFVPPGAIAASYVPPVDEYAPDSFAPFDAVARQALTARLRSGPQSPDDEGFGFELTATVDGQAGDYGVSFGATNFATAVDAENETSVLRFDLPWNLFDAVAEGDVIAFLQRVAGLFPFSSGNAGLSFNFTVGYTTAAADEIQKLLPRYWGFDSTYGSPQLEMRGKSPSAHWINLLDSDLVTELGGADRLRSDLAECQITGIGGGLMIRAARFPPVVDVNRQGRDVARLPDVARAIQPVRFDEGAFTPLGDEERGSEWLRRFDSLESREWDNAES